MNKTFKVSALSLVILVGILIIAAGPLILSEQALETEIRLDEDPAPAIVVTQIPVAEDSVRFDQVEVVLNQSKKGRQLLRLKETYGVTVQFEAGRGSRFQKSTNLILLDSGNDPAKAALHFAHEMVHAQLFNEGESANINSESRQTYINLKIQEEVEGMIASFMVKMELERIGVDVTDITIPMEDIFHQAYQAAIEQTRLVDSSLGTQQIEAIGQAAGLQALFDAFSSGEIKTSNTHEPYTDYFANRWDAANEL